MRDSTVYEACAVLTVMCVIGFYNVAAIGCARAGRRAEYMEQVTAAQLAYKQALFDIWARGSLCRSPGNVMLFTSPVPVVITATTECK